MLPDQKTIVALHKKYAPSEELFELVYTHCKIVRDIAFELIATKHNETTLDLELVEVGCLLHDIGVYPLFDQNGSLREDVSYIQHGIEGERILRDEGYPEKLWRIASHHTGVGLTKKDILEGKLALPLKDYTAQNQEELLVMYADKFHSKTTPPYFNSFDWYMQDVAKFGSHKAEDFTELSKKFGIPNLERLSKHYGHKIRG